MGEVVWFLVGVLTCPVLIALWCAIADWRDSFHAKRADENFRQLQEAWACIDAMKAECKKELERKQGTNCSTCGSRSGLLIHCATGPTRAGGFYAICCDCGFRSEVFLTWEDLEAALESVTGEGS